MIVLGVEDIEKCIEYSKQVGKWRAWREFYYIKYQAVFAPMLKHLYRCGVDDLRPAVEKFDFENALMTANRFLAEGGVALTQEVIAKSQKRCPFERNFDLYFLVGLGNVDGTSLPSGKPFLYFGLERYESEARTRILVPHEYNHLVRSWSVYRGELDLSSFTLGDAVISEGLAVVFAGMISDEETPATNPLLMPQTDIAYCDAHCDELVDEVLLHWNEPFTWEAAEAYTNGRSTWKDGRPSRIGYYVGAHVVKTALGWAYGIGELTKMTAERIRQIYQG